MNILVKIWLGKMNAHFPSFSWQAKHPNLLFLNFDCVTLHILSTKVIERFNIIYCFDVILQIGFPSVLNSCTPLTCRQITQMHTLLHSPCMCQFFQGLCVALRLSRSVLFKETGGGVLLILLSVIYSLFIYLLFFFDLSLSYTQTPRCLLLPVSA